MGRTKPEERLMRALADESVVSFATAADQHWLVLNDSNRYVSPDLVDLKIEAREYIVARFRGEVVGYIRFSCFWSFIPMIDIIAVQESLRRMGIGRALLGFLEEHARSTEQTIILSSSQADEPEPQAWHRAVGFNDAGAIVDLSPLQDMPEIVFINRLGRDA
jgi:GNAT superfamily N-acetyltransferase